MSARGFAAGIAAAITELAVLLAVVASPSPGEQHARPAMVCEGSICEPTWRYWAGPLDWTTPYGTVGAHNF